LQHDFFLVFKKKSKKIKDRTKSPDQVKTRTDQHTNVAMVLGFTPQKRAQSSQHIEQLKYDMLYFLRKKQKKLVYCPKIF